MREGRSGIASGVIMITVGLAFLADRQGILAFDRLWPAILIVAGVTKLSFPTDPGPLGRRRKPFSGVWLILVGAILLANQNDWMPIQQSWPLFIIAGGLLLIFGGLNRRSPVIDTTDPNRTQGDGSWR